MLKEVGPLKLDESILPLTCDKCDVSKSRLVQFPSYPVLRPGRILIVSEFPSVTALREKSANPMLGHSWDVMLRVFKQIGAQPHYFSYSPIVRCWRIPGQLVLDDAYATCSQYISTVAEMAEAPVIIALGSMVVKSLLPDNVCYSAGVYVGGHKLRTMWSDVPITGKVGFPVIPTEHPAGVKLIRCNSQVTFRTIVMDFIRAIHYAATINDSYVSIAKQMNSQIYISGYNNATAEKSGDSSL